MSLSSSGAGGRVIIGLQSKELRDVECREDSPWMDECSQEEFVERVREKARSAARDVIARAMEESEQIKSRAYQEGLSEGRNQGRQENEKMAGELADRIHKVLDGIATQREKIYAGYRRDMVVLLKAAVDKVLGWQLEEEREKTLFKLFDEAVEHLASGEELTVQVRPEDKEIVDRGVAVLKENRPRMGNVQVVPSNDLEKGGVVVENENGIVDNSIESRLQAVRQILDQISLEPE
jgi:flagellar assembly protein FliH